MSTGSQLFPYGKHLGIDQMFCYFTSRFANLFQDLSARKKSSGILHQEVQYAKLLTGQHDKVPVHIQFPLHGLDRNALYMES